MDPDFVQLYGVTIQNGALTVPAARPTVQIEASESSDPGDSQGHVTLQATVTAPGVKTATVASHGTGLVVLSIRLAAPQPGRTYTVGWTATFDNGMHACPAPYTLANMTSSPYVVHMTR
ncbi:MAG TPA: hypothetical protein VKI19_02060 [Acidimicrobiales bacterium]|nr:hypothetical protein [Acidimicrobiales bacterium]